MKSLLLVVFTMFVFCGLSYSTMSDAMRCNEVIATNWINGATMATDVIATCDWRGPDVNTNTICIVSAIITNVFNGVSVGTNWTDNAVENMLLHKRRILQLMNNKRKYRSVVLSESAIDSICAEISLVIPYNLKAALSRLSNDYCAQYGSNVLAQSCCPNDERWLPYLMNLQEMENMNMVIKAHRNGMILRASPYLRAYRDSLSPSDAIAFTNRFITVAGLSTNEVRQVFGE